MTVTSNSFFIEGDYKILWSSTSVFEDGKTTILKEGTASKGSLAVTNSFPIPEAPSGLYYVGFIRLGRDDPTIFSFTVVSYLRVQPLSASPGSIVTVAGTGLPADSMASLTFDIKSTDANGITNKNGSLTVDFTIPDTPTGEHQIAATSSKITTPIPPTTILVVPAITVNPQFPQTGNSVTINGRGFASKVLVSITFNELTMTNSPSTDDTGSFSYSFTLPQSKDHGKQVRGQRRRGQYWHLLRWKQDTNTTPIFATTISTTAPTPSESESACHTTVQTDADGTQRTELRFVWCPTGEICVDTGNFLCSQHYHLHTGSG